MPTDTITIPHRYAGPPFAANGGYVAGLLAEATGLSSAHVELRSPVPLGRPLTLEIDHPAVELGRHGKILAHASPAWLIDMTHPRFDAKPGAAAAGAEEHPFPSCFVCGPARPSALGLRLVPRAAMRDPVAIPWTPTGHEANPDGTLPVRIVTAALDCPSAFPLIHDGGAALLASITFRMLRAPRVGEPLVVLGWTRSSTGRRTWAASAITSVEGETLARANTVWISVDAERLATIGKRTMEAVA